MRQVTDFLAWNCCAEIKLGASFMSCMPTQLTTGPDLKESIRKFAMAGEQAGFTTEQMIDLLHDGLPVETLLELIVWRLTANATVS